MDFYDSWWYLYSHDMFKEENGVSSFENCTDVLVVKVNPRSNVIEDNQSLNTKTQIWLESGAYGGILSFHDIDLDCGADTYEEAIIELARLVKENYDK